MDGLLHWDFHPGLAVEAQVRRRFKTQVHFSPSLPTKKFFLVASFSKVSFPLSPTSVGLALQCCIGGIAASFRVIQLGDRNFRFSVASNRVGHFIYGLRDRLWPDFVCHFRIFKPNSLDFLVNDDLWHADNEIEGVSARKPMAISSKLAFLHHSATLDKSNSSVVLNKFGADNNSLASGDVHTQESTLLMRDPDPVGSIFGHPMNEADFMHAGIQFGSLSSSFLHGQVGPSHVFTGTVFSQEYWKTIPDDTLFHILDLWQANYSDEELKNALNIKSVPPAEFIYSRLLLCSRCSALGHLSSACEARMCDVRLQVGLHMEVPPLPHLLPVHLVGITGHPITRYKN